MNAVPVNKILPYSVVDGPGCRATVFLQGCNLACAYCHNPETQKLCIACGECVPQCPVQALSMQRGNIRWDAAKCVQCDRCISVCTHRASPKIRWMTPEQVMEQVCKSIPFIRGITVSGGECGLYPDFLQELFSLAKKQGLSCLMDSNGAVDLTQYPALMALCDGVMMDVKAWDLAVYRKLTAGDGRTTQKNLAWLAYNGKLQEVRIVVLPDLVDAQACVQGIANYLTAANAESILLKLIRFRPFGVRGGLENVPPPDVGSMEQLRQYAHTLGLHNVTIV